MNVVITGTTQGATTDIDGDAALPVPIPAGKFYVDLVHQWAFLDGLVPGDLGPLAAGELHRVLETAFAMAVLTHGRALGAMAAHIER